MSTNQVLFYELYISRTHDAFVLDAKSLAAAQEEAKTILKNFCKGMTPRKILNTCKTAVIETYTATHNACYPATITNKKLQATTPVK